MIMFDQNKRNGAPTPPPQPSAGTVPAAAGYPTPPPYPTYQHRPSYKNSTPSPTNFTIGNHTPDGMNHSTNLFNSQATSVGEEVEGALRYGPEFGLPQGVMVPPSVYEGLLQGDVLLALQRMPADQINVAFTQYDYQIKKRGTFIRNKRGYLMGIINSGPKFGLPQGVIIPPCLTPAMVQGEILELLRTMPVYQINITLGDYDEQMRKKGSTIRNKQAYFLGVVKKKKKEFETAPFYDQMNIHNQNYHLHNQMPSQYPHQHHHPENPYPSNPPDMRRSLRVDTGDVVPAQDPTSVKPEDGGTGEGGEQNEGELDETLHLLSDSLERVRLLTESLGKVTNELVAERENRDALEALIKSEQEFRKATEDNLIKAVEDLAQEKDLREVEKLKFEAMLLNERREKEEIDKELDSIKTKVEEEVEARKAAEEKLLMLEEILISERNVRDEERHVAIPDFSERSAGWT